MLFNFIKRMCKARALSLLAFKLLFINLNLALIDLLLIALYS
jgi:hypothetical protein